MNNKELVGRSFVLLGYAWLIHISEWYSNLPIGSINLRTILTVVILFGIIYWVTIPISSEVRNG